jgi:hypothetical protein
VRRSEQVIALGNGSTKVFAVPSGGGHREQMMLPRRALNHYGLPFATHDPALAPQRGIADANALPDCNQNKSLTCAFPAVAVRISLFSGAFSLC